MGNKRLKLENKFIIIIVLVGIFGFGVLGYVTYIIVGKLLIEKSKTDAMSMAEIAGYEIDGDIFASVTSVEDENYSLLYEELVKYRSSEMITYIYALKPEGDHMVFVVDTDPKAPAGFLEEYVLLEDMKPALAGKVCCDKELTEDRWGTYFSAYAPIYDGERKVVGIVGCDIEVSQIKTMLRQLRYLIIVLISFFAAASIGIYILMSRVLLNRDFVTELYNSDKLVKVGKRLEKKGVLNTYCILHTQIKDFKYMNQRFGSDMGDDVLRAYAVAVKALLEKNEFVANAGSEDFYVLIKKEREKEFYGKLNVLDVTINNLDGEQTFPVRSTCGMYSIRDNDSIYQAMLSCDLAHNATKKKNSMDFMIYEESMHKKMIEEKDMLFAYQRGLVENEFVAFYQPKVDITTNTLCGAEALVRWFQNGKLISPGTFIPVLEDNNQITELDFYIFERVCKDIRNWLDRGIPVVRISSNFSKLHLYNPTFHVRMLQILEKYDIDPKYIEVELTESSGFLDFDALTKFIDHMNEANIYTSIDDFGTGYSSLSLIRDLNVNVIKIDKSFFDHLNSGQKSDVKMVENVIRMIQDLEREVICEGIETTSQVDFLRSMECPVVQGFLYDRPLSHDDFEKRLLNPQYSV